MAVIYKNQHIIDFLISLITKYAQGKEKIVIGIEGTSGIGKTTLIKIIKRQFNEVTVLHTDFLHLKGTEKAKVLKRIPIKSKIFEEGWFDKVEIQKIISEFTENKTGEYKITRKILGKKKVMIVDFSKKILLVDGVFLQNKDIFGDHINKTILLETDNKSVQKRRVARRLKHRSHRNGKIFSDLFDIAWSNYLREYRVHKVADAIIELVSR